MPSNSGDGNNTDISNSRNYSSNIKDNSNSRIVSKAACKRQGSCNSNAPATSFLLQQRCSCNSNAPATSVLLQQRCPCNSRATATAGFL